MPRYVNRQLTFNFRLLLVTVLTTSCMKRSESSSELKNNETSKSSSGRYSIEEFSVPTLMSVNQYPVILNGADRSSIELQLPPLASRQMKGYQSQTVSISRTIVKTTYSLKGNVQSNPLSTVVGGPSVNVSGFGSHQKETEWPVEVVETFSAFIFAGLHPDSGRYIIDIVTNEKGLPIDEKWGFKAEENINAVILCEKTVSVKRNSKRFPQVTIRNTGGGAVAITANTPGGFGSATGEYETSRSGSTTEGEFLISAGALTSKLLRPDLNSHPRKVVADCVEEFDTEGYRETTRKAVQSALFDNKFEVHVATTCNVDKDCEPEKPVFHQPGKARCEYANERMSADEKAYSPKVCRMRAQKGELCTMYDPTDKSQLTPGFLEADCDTNLVCTYDRLPNTFKWPFPNKILWSTGIATCKDRP